MTVGGCAALAMPPGFQWAQGDQVHRFTNSLFMRFCAAGICNLLILIKLCDAPQFHSQK
jgi:hypothetical protein